MRLRIVVALALATAGCDELFGLDTVAPIDAPDAPPPCFRPEPFGQDCRAHAVPLLADTYLDAANPDRANGNRDGLLITDVNPGVFKFDTTGIASGERIAGASFSIRSLNAENALACSPTQTACALCATTIERWDLYWMTPAWTQGAATFNAGDTAWAVPGAAGMPQDRSALLATGPRPTTTKPMVLTVGADQMMLNPPECYASATDLALLLQVEGGGGWFFSSENNPCNANDFSPALELTLCR